MTLKAKTLLKDRFWIVEDNGKRVGTLSHDEEKYIFNNTSGDVRFFDNMYELKERLGETVFEDTGINGDSSKEVHGYPTSSTPYNAMFDVKRKLPLFTKSEKSKSLYCAGYYIIRFEKGWVKSFCPKLITVERYKTYGPYKTDLEMRQELSRVNR